MFLKRSNNKEVEKFLSYVTKLEMIETIGIARLLGVELMAIAQEKEEKKEKKKRENSSIEAPEDSNTDETATNLPALVRNQQNDKQEFKEFDILLSEMLDSFIAAPKQKRKWILQMMKDATYGGK